MARSSPSLMWGPYKNTARGEIDRVEGGGGEREMEREGTEKKLFL